MKTKKIGITLVGMLLIATISVAVTANNEIYKIDDEISKPRQDIWPMFQNTPGHTGFAEGNSPDNANVIFESTTIPNKAGGIQCINAYNGKNKWVNPSVGTINKAPVFAGGKIIAVNSESIYGFDPINGNLNWQRNLGSGVISIVASNNKVVAVLGDLVTCLNATNGNVIWDTTLSSVTLGTYADPAIEDDKICISVEQRVICLNLESGDVEWDETIIASPSEFFYSNPVSAHNGNIYVVSITGTLYCIDANDGSEKWNYEVGFSPSDSIISPAIAYENIYIGAGNQFICLDSSTGDLVWSYSSTGTIKTSPAVADNKVYFTDNSALYCLDAQGNGDGSTDTIFIFNKAEGTTPFIGYGILYAGFSSHPSRCIGFSSNSPPEKPSIEAPFLNKKNEPIPFTVSSSDSNGDDINYFFKWSIEDSWHGPFGPYGSGEEAIVEHTYPADVTENTTYFVSVQARDIYAFSSEEANITVAVNNTKPKTPEIISAPEIGRIDTSYEFEFEIDDEEDDVMEIAWIITSDSKELISYDWEGEYMPGTYTDNIIFEEAGNYEVSLICREKYGDLNDNAGFESDVSNPVTIEILQSEVECSELSTTSKILQGATFSMDITAGDRYDEENIEWQIIVEGGILGLIDHKTKGNIEKLELGETITVSTNQSIIGLGPITIKTKVDADGLSSPIFREYEGKMFFFWATSITEI